MKLLILLVFLTLGTAFAGTHVNISFTQQHLQNVGSLDESRNDQVQLKPSDTTFEQYRSESNYRGDQNNERFARIQADDKKSNANLNNDNNNNNNQRVVAESKMNTEPASDYQTRSERVQNTGRSGHYNHQSHDQQRRFHNSNNGDHQQFEQLRKMNVLNKQNMEFERYIQNYHSSPSVETVFESAKPGMQYSSKTSTVNEGPQRVVATNQRMSKVQKFERQVALPSTSDNLQPAVDTNKQSQTVANHQPVQAAPETAASTSSSASSSSSSVSVPSVSSPSGNHFKVNLNQRPASVGSDGINFDLSTSYNKPNYNDPTYKYSNDNSDGHFYNQYPPTVDEPQGGYGDYYQPGYSNNDDHYYGNSYDQQQGGAAYLPAEHTNQRPLVTKTIQIAQPAIKAKKYEIRHPAIQKEFYDIEERVVIKPAGTVVVELERPVAKILKDETTLALGHPHPAVAGAYMHNANSPSFSNIIYSSAGGSNQANNQYSPNYNTKNAPEHHHSAASASTLASSVTATPTYDQSSKEVIVESNLNKQYNGDNHFVAAAAATAANEPKSHNRELVVLTDSHGNQRQVPSDQFSYSRDETDKAPKRPLYNHRNPFVYNDNGHNGQVNLAPQRSGFQDSNRNNGQSNVAPQRSGFQANLSQRDGLGFEAEYINNAGSANVQKDSKPARLQEAPARLTEQQQQIIKHEHKIVLSPSQHNIYLNGKHEVPQAKFVEEAAHVREIKPFLQNHRGPMIVYASSKPTPDLAYTQRSEYHPQARVSSQVVQYRDPARVSHAKSADKRVDYSAPYAQMRYHPDDDEQYSNYHQTQSGFYNHDRNDRRKSEKLILEENPKTDMMKKSNDDMMEKQAPQAHIEIELPHHSTQNANNANSVSSTQRPMMMMMNENHGKVHMHNSKLEISISNNGETKQEQRETKTHNMNDNNGQKHSVEYNDNSDSTDGDSEQVADLKTKSDCEKSSADSANYESDPEQRNYGQQKFMRIVESSSAAESSANDAKSAVEPELSNSQSQNVDINGKGTNGHVLTPGSRVIAATPAHKDAAPSESFHKKRIVVNHPFQTVREVVEHEPYTNYHEVQVSEPASPAVYHSANYFQSHGALRQPEHLISPIYYH